MNKNKALLAGAAMVALSMPLAQKEAEAASAGIQASAQIIQALTLAAGNNMHFGAYTQTAAGSVVLSTTGSATPTGLTEFGGLSQNGTFTYTGSSGPKVDFSTPLPLALSNGTNATKLSVTRIVLGGDLSANVTLTGGANTASGTLAAAAGTINVGGTLQVGATAPQGVYTGTLTLSANYQ